MPTSAPVDPPLLHAPPKQLLAATLGVFAALSSLYFQALASQTASGVAATATSATSSSGNNSAGKGLSSQLVSRALALPDALRPCLDELPLLRDVCESGGGSSSPVTSAHLLRVLEELDDFLSTLLDLVRHHAANQCVLRHLSQEARRADATALRRIRELNRLKSRLDRVVTEAKKERDAADRARRAPVRAGDVLSYADLLSRTTSAPPGYSLASLLSGGPGGSGEKAAGDGRNADDQAGAGEGVAEKRDEKQQQQPQPPPPLAPAEMPFPDEAQMQRTALRGGAPRWRDFLAEAETAEGVGNETGGGRQGAASGYEEVGSSGRGGRGVGGKGGGGTLVSHGEADDEGDAFNLDLN